MPQSELVSKLSKTQLTEVSNSTGLLNQALVALCLHQRDVLKRIQFGIGYDPTSGLLSQLKDEYTHDAIAIQELLTSLLNAAMRGTL